MDFMHNSVFQWFGGTQFVSHIKRTLWDKAFDEPLVVWHSHSGEEAREQIGLALKAENIIRGRSQIKYLMRE